MCVNKSSSKLSRWIARLTTRDEVKGNKPPTKLESEENKLGKL